MTSTRALWFLLALALVVGVIGCSDDDKSTNGEEGVPTELRGIWTHTGASVNDSVRDLAEFYAWQPTTVTARTAISGDGSTVYREFDVAGTVLYETAGKAVVSGATLSLSRTSENGVPIDPPEVLFVGSYARVGDTLTLTSSIAGTTTVLTFLKN